MASKEVIVSDWMPAPKGPYSPAVRAGGFVFVSGQGPVEAETGEVCREGIKEQTTLALTNVRLVLEGAGCGLEQVVKTTVYLTDMADFAAMNEVYATFFTTQPPARTTVAAAALPLGDTIAWRLTALDRRSRDCWTRLLGTRGSRVTHLDSQTPNPETME